MSKKLATLGFTLVFSLSAVVLSTGSPASAGGTNGPLCMLNSNAWMFNWPLSGSHIADVHAGHQFRVHDTRVDKYDQQWAYGHSGENPAQDGFILATHLSC